MKFLVDMPLSPDLAAWLREQGHDPVHASERGLYRASDIDIVAVTKGEGRTVVTADLDYPRLLAMARTTDPSLVLFRDGDWSDVEVIARMSEVLRSLSEVEIAQSIVVVDHGRLRRRRLPIASGFE